MLRLVVKPEFSNACQLDKLQANLVYHDLGSVVTNLVYLYTSDDLSLTSSAIWKAEDQILFERSKMFSNQDDDNLCPWIARIELDEKYSVKSRS